VQKESQKKTVQSHIWFWAQSEPETGQRTKAQQRGGTQGDQKRKAIKGKGKKSNTGNYEGRSNNKRKKKEKKKKKKKKKKREDSVPTTLKTT